MIHTIHTKNKNKMFIYHKKYHPTKLEMEQLLTDLLTNSRLKSKPKKNPYTKFDSNRLIFLTYTATSNN